MLPYKFILFFILFGYTRIVSPQIAVYPLFFKDVLESRLGLGWPKILHVASGHTALIKLNRTLINQEICEVRTPLGQVLNLNNLPSDRYEPWSNGCGIKIKNITKADEGRWRMTSIRGEDSLVGYSEVHVVDSHVELEDSVIYLEDGLPNVNINLTELNNYYCMVAQPFAHSSLIPGHCEVSLEKTSRAIQGVWNVLLGLPGHVPEIDMKRDIAVKTQHLDVGFIRDTISNKLHLYCNIKYSNKNITFCRFQRVAETDGYNLVDGLSDGYYSYYGDGFISKHCGISIEKPSSKDYSTWRCSVGVQEIEDNKVVYKTPMQALISVTGQSGFSGRLVPKTIEVQKVFTQIGSVLKIDCHVNEELSYCWFQHPNGSQFTPVLDGDLENHSFWYSGESLQMGDCSISFNQADESLSGLWTCHMGSKNNLGLELTDSVLVRVAGPLTANVQVINTTIYQKETLYCHTAGVTRSIKYCRFVSPNFVGINIDLSITAENALFGRYYFTPNRSLDYGDCSMTIDPVLDEDLGNWTCAALIVGFTSESRDFVYVSFKESPTLTAASITVIIIGSLVLISMVSTAVFYRSRLYACVHARYARTMSMQQLARSSRTSDSSNESIPQAEAPPSTA